MAYSNWGAFVFMDGERQRNKEDVPPYGDADVEAVGPAARIWVNLIKAREKYKEGEQPFHEHCHHAVLGKGRVRLCAYKSCPEIFLAQEDGSVERIEVSRFRIASDTPEAKWDWRESDGIDGEIEGYRFKARPLDKSERIELEMIEPDGTKWTGTSGYCMGSGYDD